jgi:hypothetical protein
MELVEATGLHAAFREENRTSLPLASAALQEIRERGTLSWFSRKENHASRSLCGRLTVKSL